MPSHLCGKTSSRVSSGLRRFRAPRIVVRGELEQERVQRAPLLGVERGEKVLLDLLRDRA
jgi:hypothetical protein